MTGRIVKALSGFYYVEAADGVIECRARGIFRKEGQSPLVGDQVEISRTGKRGMIEAIASELKKARTRPRVLMITDDPRRPKVVITVNAK